MLFGGLRSSWLPWNVEMDMARADRARAIPAPHLYPGRRQQGERCTRASPGSARAGNTSGEDRRSQNDASPRLTRPRLRAQATRAARTASRRSTRTTRRAARSSSSCSPRARAAWASTCTPPTLSSSSTPTGTRRPTCRRAPALPREGPARSGGRGRPRAPAAPAQCPHRRLDWCRPPACALHCGVHWVWPHRQPCPGSWPPHSNLMSAPHLCMCPAPACRAGGAAPRLRTALPRPLAPCAPCAGRRERALALRGAWAEAVLRRAGAGHGPRAPHRPEEGGAGVPLLRGEQHRGEGARPPRRPPRRPADRPPCARARGRAVRAASYTCASGCWRWSAACLRLSLPPGRAWLGLRAGAVWLARKMPTCTKKHSKAASTAFSGPCVAESLSQNVPSVILPWTCARAAGRPGRRAGGRARGCR